MGSIFFWPRAACGTAHASISPVDQAMADVRQRLSWVRREMRTEHPEMDEAELDLITRRDSASILVEEVMRLRGETRG